jgi:protein-disulfide isomerase
MSLTPPVTARDHAQGSATAPLTLVEYGDYECSYCGKAYPIIKAVQRALGAKLRFVFRNYPLTQLHPHALHAAEVAEAVALHGKFWEIHDTLFEHQRALTDAHLLDHARRLGLDPDKIATEATSEPVISRIKADMAGADTSEIQGTPSFFINGEGYDGPWDEASLLAALQAALR